MANTYVKIASTTVGVLGASTIDFTSIPSTYTDLTLQFSIRSNAANTVEVIQYSFNGSTSSRTVVRFEGNGSTVSAATSLPMFAYMGNGATSTANTFGSGSIYIPNYAGSANKSSSNEGVAENNASSASEGMAANLWSSTAAINQITLVPYIGTTFLQYSTATLYGISKS